jgi:hypothetical protein
VSAPPHRDVNGLADEPENEIEITEAMIEAGSEELALFNPSEDTLCATVVLIYEAMIRVKAKSCAAASASSPEHHELPNDTR